MKMNDGIDVKPILILARSGATAQAWEMFAAAGYAARPNDPAALTLKGRLLKDRARSAYDPAERQRLFAEAAEAYATAAELAPSSYPLINAATMALFAGNQERARSLAAEVETMISSGLDQGETAYWRDATRAEALLLLERRDDAVKALDAAIAHAPQAWEDLATTLRQLRLICELRGEKTEWLARYAPPVSLHYSGLIGLAGDDLDAADRIGAMLDEIKPGFAYGALAAGADILIAEASLARGSELHVILPTQPSIFRAMSVEPYGVGWTERFDRLFEQAASVCVVAPQLPLSHASILLAADIATGCAAQNARRMESRACSLRVVSSGDDILVDPDLHVIRVDRTDMSASDLPLADADLRIWLATDATDGALPHIERLPDMQTAVARLAMPSEQATALDCQVTAIGKDDSEQKSRVARMVQAALPGMTIVGFEAAMSLLSVNPKYRLEPLGELASNAGPVAIYSMRQ